MTDKELKHLSRNDLLEILIAQMEENETLKAQLKAAQEQAGNRQIAIDEAGSIAEAALRLNGVFDAAQAAAAQYLENVQRLGARQRAGRAPEGPSEERPPLEEAPKEEAPARAPAAAKTPEPAKPDAQTAAYSEKLRADAVTYSKQVRAGADAYSARVRAEADAYSRRVRHEAEVYLRQMLEKAGAALRPANAARASSDPGGEGNRA